MFTYTTYAKVPFKCPICLGCGNVPGGFYTSTVGHIEGWTSANAQEECRQCKGIGIIWTSNEDENKGS